MQSKVESLLEQFKTSMEGERMLDNKLGILVKYIKQMNVKEQFDMCHEKLLKNKEALYLEYRHNELSSLRSQRKYLKIFFHIVLRKMKPVSKKIAKWGGHKFDDGYFEGRLWYDDFNRWQWMSIDMPDGIMFLEDIKANIDKYVGIYNLLSDSKSKETLIAILYARILLDPQKLICESTAQYFDKDIISCDENEVIADCGAFTGDSAETYINLYKVYKRIYLFEPDKVNGRIAQGGICKRYSDIIIKPFGVYNENKEISFIGGDGPSSKIGEDSRSMETIQVVTIDSEIREPITFIKMDIEGSEYQAIEGAKEHIKADKPKLAICVYHKPDDIWKIAMLIKGLNPQYSLYLRHYTDVFAETVLYAV